MAIQRQDQRGFTLIELLVVIVILGILSVIAIPQFNQYKMRSYDVQTKSSLKQLFMACKSYWIDTDPAQACTLAVATNSSYGFVPNTNVTLVPAGSETNFNATGQHSESPNVFSVDSTGTVQ